MPKLTTLAKAAVVLFTLGASIGPTIASARPYFDIERTYYDANGVEVGSFIINCTGVTQMIGVTSPIFYEVRTPCDEYPDHPE